MVQQIVLITKKIIWYLMQALRRTFNFKSRASRAEWWIIFLCICIPLCILYIVDLHGILSVPLEFGTLGFLQVLSDILLNFLKIAIILFLPIPILSTSVRRFHDVDMSGAWIFFGLAHIMLPFVSGNKGANRFGNPQNYPN